MYSFSKVMGAVALLLCLLSVADSQLFQITDLISLEMVTGDVYRINQGYQLALFCFYNGRPSSVTWNRNLTQVPSIIDVTTLSVTNTSELIEGLSTSDFRQLFQSRTSVTSVMSNYVNESELILPNSSIGGQYTCQADNGEMQNLTIIVTSPSGSFSEFYIRMTGLISNASTVNDKDFDLAVFESRLSVDAVIAGLNASDYPIRTMSCSFVPLTAEHVGNQSLDRIECNVREYPPNEQFMLNVSQRIFETIDQLVSESFQQVNISEFGFCNRSYTTSSMYGNYTWPETALTNSSGSSVSLPCNSSSGSVTRTCRTTGWDAPDYNQCRSSAETISIIDINGVFVRESYAINEGYIFALVCGIFDGGIFGSSSPTGGSFKWFDSNGNEVQNLTKFINSSFTSTSDGTRLLNEGLSVSDFKGLYSHQITNEFVDLTYLASYIDFNQEGDLSDLILPGTSISGTYTCRSSSGNYSQTISVNTRNPSGPFSQFFFRFTASFANISITDVEDKDYELAVLETNIFYEGVVGDLNSTLDPIRTISCHFVPLMEEDGTGDRVECDVREYPSNSSFVEVVWQSISTFLSDFENNVLHSIVMSETGFCNQSQTVSLDFGLHTWPESVGNTILTMPCGNRPLMDVTRLCQTNGLGWGNPDYSQCETSTCENETIVTNRGIFQWPVTPVESLADLICPHGPNGSRAIRQCRRNGVWDTHDISNCADPRITAEFTRLTDTNVTVENVVEVAQNLSEVVMLASQPGDQNENNLRSISSLLIQTATLFSSPDIIIMLSTEEVSMTTESTVEILDSVQEWPPQVVAMESNNIVQSFERIVDALISQENFTNLTIIETGIAFQGLRIQRTDFSGITFVGSSSNDSLSTETLDLESSDINELDLATISLPASISTVTEADDINLAFTLYTQSTLFPILEPIPDTVVGSSVISASVDGISDGTVLPDNVTVNLRIVVENATNHRCVYWDFTAADGRGNWSNINCTTTVDPDTNDTVTCSCNHLTNFACLVDISSRTGAPPPPRPVTVALEIVSYIGVSLSLLGLVLTILTLLIFKSLRQRDASKFHIQLCLSLIFMLIVFVAGIDRVSVRAGCITVGVLIHYFALVSWMWMGAEAVLMFQKLVIVFSNITWKYILIVSLVCWGVPLLPVAIALSVDVDHYITFYENTQQGFCFIGQLGVFLTAFLVPLMLILIFNLVIYILILRVLILHAVRKNKRLQKSSMTPSEAVKMMLSFTGIMFLLGLTWIFGIFTFISEPGVSYALQFLFAFFNAFQGFFIFIFFVVLSSDARAAWKSLLCPCLVKEEQKTSKYYLSSSNHNKKRLSNDTSSNIYSSSTFGSKDDTLNEKSVLAKLSEADNENALPPLVEEEDDFPAYHDDSEKKNGDLDLVQLKGARVKRHSTRKHTRHVEQVDVDFYDSDDDDAYDIEV